MDLMPRVPGWTKALFSQRCVTVPTYVPINSAALIDYNFILIALKLCQFLISFSLCTTSFLFSFLSHSALWLQFQILNEKSICSTVASVHQGAIQQFSLVSIC